MKRIVEVRDTNLQQYNDEFRRAMGLDLFQPVTLERVKRDGDKLREEIHETIAALNVLETLIEARPDMSEDDHRRVCAELLKELMDTIYCVMSFCSAFGWDANEAFRRVHRSNMSKLVDGKPLLNERGWVQKGPNYRKPYLEDLV